MRNFVHFTTTVDVLIVEKPNAINIFLIYIFSSLLKNDLIIFNKQYQLVQSNHLKKMEARKLMMCQHVKHSLHIACFPWFILSQKNVYEVFSW